MIMSFSAAAKTRQCWTKPLAWHDQFVRLQRMWFAWPFCQFCMVRRSKRLWWDTDGTWKTFSWRALAASYVWHTQHCSVRCSPPLFVPCLRCFAQILRFEWDQPLLRWPFSPGWQAQEEPTLCRASINFSVGCLFVPFLLTCLCVCVRGEFQSLTRGGSIRLRCGRHSEHPQELVIFWIKSALGNDRTCVAGKSVRTHQFGCRSPIVTSTTGAMAVDVFLLDFCHMQCLNSMLGRCNREESKLAPKSSNPCSAAWQNQARPTRSSWWTPGPQGL